MVEAVEVAVPVLVADVVALAVLPLPPPPPQQQPTVNPQEARLAKAVDQVVEVERVGNLASRKPIRKRWSGKRTLVRRLPHWRANLLGIKSISLCNNVRCSSQAMGWNRMGRARERAGTALRRKKSMTMVYMATTGGVNDAGRPCFECCIFATTASSTTTAIMNTLLPPRS